MTKLLPCPFCGGKANIRNIAASVLFDCICEDCGATTKCEPARGRAVAAWNRRTEQASAEVRGLQQELDSEIEESAELALQAATLKARVAELEETLKPFDRLAELMEDGSNWEDDDTFSVMWGGRDIREDTLIGPIDVGELRRARAALAKGGQEYD